METNAVKCVIIFFICLQLFLFHLESILRMKPLPVYCCVDVSEAGQ